MSFAHILAPLFGLESDQATLQAAHALARSVGGHVLALHAIADPLKTTPLMVDVGVAIAEVVAAAERHAEKRRTDANSSFDAWAKESGVVLNSQPARPATVSAEFRAEKGQETELLARHGRLTDIIVIARPQAEQALDLVAIAVEDALFSAGRPVLLVPGNATAQHLEQMLSGSVIISWNGTIEASRAVHAAIPLLQRRQRVRVVAVKEGPDAVQSASELVHYLAWHGVPASVGEASEAGTVAERLLSATREIDAGLLVMGAYSHSRLRHLVLGGVTSHMIDAANIPVLMMH
jgi:nucleotide-binding universal stress UspA family protein